MSEDNRVLIAGGGPIGYTTAINLASMVFHLHFLRLEVEYQRTQELQLSIPRH